MRYSDIIGIHEYFAPFYVIDDEHKDYWKQFIPNSRFNELLKQVVDVVDTKDTSVRKSFWIQGSFGTGKSHAAGVVKQLLWAEPETISEYIEEHLTDNQLRARLLNFRKNHKLLPIVISGIENITDHRSFSLEVENAVKKTLRNQGIDINVKSEFDRYIEKAENGTMPCEFLIENDKELGLYVNTKEEIIEKLRAGNVKFMRMLDNALSEQSIHFSHHNIKDWLLEINEEIIKNGIADGMIIFWDEFTTVMDFSANNQSADSIGAAIINLIQSIAELSTHNNIYLYLISHRKAEHYEKSRSREDILKMRDRFHTITYEIEPITTFHVLSAAIKKIDRECWNKEKDSLYSRHPQLDNLITELTGNHSSHTKEAVKNLFPIHPYSAYLSTFIARNIGSANRSIFEFLYNKESGFKNFLHTEIESGELLTADYLWDYFAETFEQDSKGDFIQVLDKYRLFSERMQTKGALHLKVFKVILLLNVLYKKVSISSETQHYVAPSTTNIISLFLGSSYQHEISGILDYIDEKGIVGKTPTDHFLIEFSSLPYHEVEKEKEKLQGAYNNDVVKILADTKQKTELEDRIFKDSIYRANEISFLPCMTSYNEHVLKSRLLNPSTFKKSYTLHIAFFLSKTEEDTYKTMSFVENLCEDEDLNSVIFVFAEEAFGENNYEKYIDFIARKQISEIHQYDEQAINYNTYATQQVEKWVNTIKDRNMTVYFQGKRELILANTLGAYINNQYAPAIFSKGIDQLPIHKNIWKEQKIKGALAAEKVLFSEDRSEMNTKLAKGVDSYLLTLFKNSQKEFIIDENFKIKEDLIDHTHPLVLIQECVDEILNNQRKKTQFNLGKELELLKEQPYGLYKNPPNIALMGFVLRKYVNDDLQTADTGRVIGKEAMRDLIAELFESWEGKSSQNKLQLRFGSREERKLKLKLVKLFDLVDVDSIIDSRFAIREYINKIAKFPLWALRYYTTKEQVQTTIDEMQNLLSSYAKDLDNNLIKRTLDAVDKYDYELRDELKPDNFKIGFTNFLLQIPEIEISMDDIVDILLYLKQSLGGEIAFWEEDKVQDKVELWYYKPKVASPDKPTPNPPVDPDMPDDEDPDTEPKSDRFMDAIRNFPYGERALKEKIVTILTNHPEIQTIFKQYFSEE